ncbi:hypothetical protein RUM43_003345 [Polyplax serrata]|uniref:F-box domain-containing protein n=1 Tax=Polyplax serrata TaxID=468196 RepID=A0AAN8RWY4_POLSC
MENLFACFFAMSSMFYDNWSDNFDIIGSVPYEVAVIILRKLDPKSLLTAIRVSKRWLDIVKSDRVLSQTVRDEFARQRREKFKMDMFLSKCVSDHIGFLSKSSKAAKPYEVKQKRKRNFEATKSVKGTEGAPTKKLRTWVSSVSSSSKSVSIRKFR